MGKLRPRRRGRHCGGGVGLGRHMVVYFCARASGFQVLCTNLLSFYSNQPPSLGPLSFPLQTHLPLGGMQPAGTAEATGGWRSGAGPCGARGVRTDG